MRAAEKFVPLPAAKTPSKSAAGVEEVAVTTASKVPPAVVNLLEKLAELFRVFP